MSGRAINTDFNRKMINNRLELLLVVILCLDQIFQYNTEMLINIRNNCCNFLLLMFLHKELLLFLIHPSGVGLIIAFLCSFIIFPDIFIILRQISDDVSQLPNSVNQVDTGIKTNGFVCICL